MWSAVIILIGIIFILLGKLPGIDDTVKKIFEFMGITLVGVFTVSLIYETFVAAKHFEDFKKLLSNELKLMDSVQSKAMKLGIKEIFETRNAYESKYPLMELIKQSPDSGKIICIARSLFHLLNKTGELKEGLEKGLTFEFVCVDPNKVTSCLEKVSLLYKSDIDSALRALKDLLSWAIEKKAKGTLELRYHWADYLDSVFIFTSKDGKNKLSWDLSFGRDLTQKRVVILDIYNHSLGNDLKNRYLMVYQNADCQIKYSSGEIKENKFGWVF